MALSKEHQKIIDHKPYPIGPDPHGAMCTGTGHSHTAVKHTPDTPMHQMKLTKEEQDIFDGKKGKVLAKVMQTVVRVGNAFGADKLVDLGGNPHTVLMFGSNAVTPIIDIFNESQIQSAFKVGFREYTTGVSLRSMFILLRNYPPDCT